MCMAVVVMKATILLWVTHRGSGAQCEWDGEVHLHRYLSGAHHLCLQGLSGRAQIARGGNGTAPCLHYEVVKEVGSDFYWCLLFSASNQNQFILLDRILYKKVKERQPKDTQSILLRIFPWYPKHDLLTICVVYSSLLSLLILKAELINIATGLGAGSIVGYEDVIITTACAQEADLPSTAGNL